mmetsp:Transcript_14460/g.29891  ORF Transcript_14460/g.29891 Transcript_14460/m.29891 type:complete len:801 (-) Transcript_14460:620-3022(-)
MDEHDHNEWGGPLRVRRDLTAGDDENDEDTKKNNPQTNSSNNDNSGFLDTALSLSTAAVVPPKNVGQQLLKELGWRGGDSNSVYVPLQDPPSRQVGSNNNNTTGKSTRNDEENHAERAFLSQRRLKKIQIQQQRIQIPPPKLDSVGLGFEAHENAPEFKAYFERRQRERIQAKEKSRRVYKLGNLLSMGDDDDDENENDGGLQEMKRSSMSNKGSNNDDNVDDSYLDYEAAHDFVGSRSVGGFALREDDDDAFDDEDEMSNLKRISNKVKINQDEYDTVIQDVEDDDEHDNDGRPLYKESTRKSEDTQREKSVLGGALAAWASGGGSQKAEDRTGATEESTTTPKDQRLALDGRPVLSGFVPSLSTSAGGEAWNQRFRGPDLPPNYTITPHQFAPNENPLVLQTLARATQLELDDARRKNLIEQALENNIVVAKADSRQRQIASNVGALEVKQRSLVPMAGNDVFKGLAQSMKDRFTTSKTSADTVQEEPQSNEVNSGNSTTPKVDPSIVTRTTEIFHPTLLLCKRFREQVPKHLGMTAAAAAPNDRQGKEEKFFEDNVLKAVAASLKTGSSHKAKPTGGIDRTESQQQSTDLNMKGGQQLPTDAIDTKHRPPMEVYRSIFASRRDEEDEPGVSDEQGKAEQDTTGSINLAKDDQSDTVPKNENTEQTNNPHSSTALVEYATRSIANGPTNERKRSTWSSDSSLDDDSASDDSAAREERRRKRKEKKRKRRKKDDRRKSRRRDRYSSEEDDGRAHGDGEEGDDADSRDHDRRAARSKRRKHKSTKRSKKRKRSSRDDSSD